MLLAPLRLSWCEPAENACEACKRAAADLSASSFVTTALTCADLYEFDPEQTRRPPYRVRVRTTLPFLGARFESVRTITISDAVPGVSCRHTLTGYVRVRGPGGEGGTRAPTAFASCITAGHGQRGAVWGADAQQLEATAV